MEYFKKEDCQTISVPKEFIPENGVLIEAYKTSKEIIILGEPEWMEEHDCDLMGCGTLSHVVKRLPLPL